MNKIDVLDHGSVELLEHMGNDLSVVRNARQSYDADWRAGEDKGGDTRLIRFLMRHRHTSPFESVVFTFGVKCPFFIARQIHRHRTWSFNEVSARYTKLPEEHYVPSADTIGQQSKDNKQMREAGVDNPNAAVIQSFIHANAAGAYAMYNNLIEQGCPRELARSVLPMSFYTRFSGTVDLHNLLHFIELRIHKHAQWEIQQYARAMLDLIEPIVPVSTAAFKEFIEIE